MNCFLFLILCQVLYVISLTDDSSPGVNNPLVEEYKKRTQNELEFTTQYYKTTGRHWLHYFNSSSGKPRGPPILPMWPSERIGFVRSIESDQLYWSVHPCSPLLLLFSDPHLSPVRMCLNETEGNCRANSLAPPDPTGEFEPQPGIAEAPSPSASSYLSTMASLLAPSLFPPSPPPTPPPKMTLRLQTISTAPRAFLIENFLSDFEAEEIIRLASPNIKESVIGQADSGGIFKSTTRTSSNTWIPRSTSPMIETIFRRVSHALGIDQTLLTFARNAEDIQVVHYNPGEEYQAHYDWGVRGYPESRFITMLLYLSDPIDSLTDSTEGSAGGETSFPKAGFKILPKRGNAVIFYSLLEDGNGDIDSLHASVPVRRGEKWLANFWVWDPELTEAIRATRK
jgi:prolyl 4-hydroxylase